MRFTPYTPRVRATSTWGSKCRNKVKRWWVKSVPDYRTTSRHCRIDESVNSRHLLPLLSSAAGDAPHSTPAALPLHPQHAQSLVVSQMPLNERFETAVEMFNSSDLTAQAAGTSQLLRVVSSTSLMQRVMTQATLKLDGYFADESEESILNALVFRASPCYMLQEVRVFPLKTFMVKLPRSASWSTQVLDLALDLCFVSHPLSLSFSCRATLPPLSPLFAPPVCHANQTHRPPLPIHPPSALIPPTLLTFNFNRWKRETL
mgnify:CR=1 FL=1